MRSTRVLVFGEPYFGGITGMHNIHLNQGTPTAMWQALENGVWQDGGLVIQYPTDTNEDTKDYRPNDTVDVVLVKLGGQTLSTDEYGHPKLMQRSRQNRAPDQEQRSITYGQS